MIYLELGRGCISSSMASLTVRSMCPVFAHVTKFCIRLLCIKNVNLGAKFVKNLR